MFPQSTYLTLTPAYGRDYKSKKAVLEALYDEYDFILEPQGVLINYQQTTDSQVLNIRYDNCRKVVVVKGKKQS